MRKRNSVQAVATESSIEQTKVTRRNFVKTAATAAAVAATIPLAPEFGSESFVAQAAPPGNGNGPANSGAANRANDCFNYRKNMALANKVNIGPQANNGDAATFTDFSCSYSKGLPHDYLGIPNAAAMTSLKNAFATGKASNFANIIVGTPGGGPNSKLKRAAGCAGIRSGRNGLALDGHSARAECRERANCCRTSRALLGSTAGRCAVH